MRGRILLAVVLLWTVGPCPSAQAQLGRVLREGVEAIAQKATRQAAKPALKRSFRAGAGSFRAALRGAANPVVAKAVAHHGAVVASPIVARFGDDGARALMTLSQPAAKQFADVADELATSPMAKDWLNVIATRGDDAVAWLWKRKGSIAVATGATAVVLSPDDFFRASGEVASTAISSAAKHVVEPVLVAGGNHVVAPVVEGVMYFITGPLLIVIGLLGLAAATGRGKGLIKHLRRPSQ